VTSNGHGGRGITTVSFNHQPDPPAGVTAAQQPFDRPFFRGK
jgi:hypothetical protein